MGRGRGAAGGVESSRGRGRSRGQRQRTAESNQLDAHLDSVTTDQGTAAGIDKEKEICFICASPVVHYAVAPCNHQTCHICALRLRALYKTKACAHCRSESQYVIFTDDGTKRFDEFKTTTFNRDDNLGIEYEKPDIFEDTVLLLRYNCPDASCDVACLGWPDLHRHVKSVHHKSMCDLCTRNKKVFTHEHELFDAASLKKHEKFGDDNPGAIDQSGFKGHPECGFCRQRFYGDDELYTHCRDRHERCHICDRRASRVQQQQYFVNYDSLEGHFRKKHFLCLEAECLEKKFVVFESELDLKAHQLEAHPGGLSKDARKDARRVDMSGFDYRTPHQQERRERDRERRRTPNVEPLPQSSAQPLRRDELAYQRQMAIQRAQPVPSRTFGGQLTSGQPPLLNGTASSSAVPNSVQTPQDQARALRHEAVTSRAATLLQNDPLKLSTFRSKISSFRSSDISATLLVDAFFTLFDCSPVELGKLIRDLADIFEADSKKKELLKAWNDWRAINDDYPALPGPSAVLREVDGKRLLKLKNSTSQSSKSPVSRSESWGPATNAQPGPSPRPQPNASVFRTETSKSSEAFPALPALSRPSASFGFGIGGRLDSSKTPWGGNSSSGVSAAASETEGEDGGKKKKAGKKKQVLFYMG